MPELRYSLHGTPEAAKKLAEAGDDEPDEGEDDEAEPSYEDDE